MHHNCCTVGRRVGVVSRDKVNKSIYCIHVFSESSRRDESNDGNSIEIEPYLIEQIAIEYGVVYIQSTSCEAAPSTREIGRSRPSRCAHKTIRIELFHLPIPSRIVLARELFSWKIYIIYNALLLC